MKNIDLTQKGGMPLDQNTLAFMQETYSDLLKQLGCVLGKYVIISGTPLTGGWVAVDGEIMPFDPGSGDNCYVRTAKESVIFLDGEAKDIYSTDKLVFGSGLPQLKWSDFQKIDTIVDLQNSLISRTPIGTVQMFAGNNVPKGWASCEGQSVSKLEYPKLWDVLQRQDPGNPANFLLPDLRGRFIVGYNPDTHHSPSNIPAGSTSLNYAGVGNTGGADNISLTGDQNGQHVHEQQSFSYFTNEWRSGDGGRGYVIEETSRLTKSSGLGTPHDNRPPYYVVKYIIFLG